MASRLGWSLVAWAAVSLGSGVAAAKGPEGPGVPNLSWAPSQLFTNIGTIDAATGAPRAHGSVAMVHGYLMIVWADDGGTNGGFGFFDISNPSAPKLVSQKYDAETIELREAHGFAISPRGSADVIVLQAIEGLQFWDIADVTAPKRLSYLKLPGAVDAAYGPGIWWSSWQGRYLYAGGSSNGLYVIDAADPVNPVLIDRGPGRPNPVPVAQTGGFRIGAVFAVGNTLTVTSMDQRGMATFDIGDPVNPVLLASDKDTAPALYNSMVNGDRLYSAGVDNRLWMHDLSALGSIALLGSAPLADRGGYVIIQDGFAHAGASLYYAKVDVHDPTAPFLVGTASHAAAAYDDDFATPLGNLTLVGDDHGHGSFLTPHDAAPDTTPPVVNMVSPRDGAVNAPLSTRIGLTFTDAVDLASISVANVVVRPVGKPPLTGLFAYQSGAIGFSPDLPLTPDTTYEIVVPAGGVRDLVGNAAKTTFVSTFSTGAVVEPKVTCLTGASTPALVGAEITLLAGDFVEATASSYTWDFGDGTPAEVVAGDVATHTWAKPGHYTVRVVAKEGGVSASCAKLQTAHMAATSARPTSSSTIAADAARGRVWVVNPDSNSVALVRAGALDVESEISVGKRPRSLAVAPDGDVWVACEDDATVRVIRAGTPASVDTVTLPRGSRPAGVALSPDGAFAYIALGGTGELARIDVATRAVTARVFVGPSPRAVAVSADGARALVTRFVSPARRGEVYDVDLTTMTASRVLALPIDEGPDTKSSGRGVPNYLSSVTFSPDGARAWITAKKDNTDRGLARDGLPLTFQSTVRTIVAQIDLATGEEDVARRKDLNDRALASSVTFSALGDYAFVTVEGSNGVEVLDAYDGQTVASLPDTGRAPMGAVIDGGRLFVQAYLTREVRVLDVHSLLTSVAFSATPVASVTTVAQEPLSPVVLRGKQIFHDAKDPRMSHNGYISCAACHHDGEEDGRVWDFTDRGEGFRNTTSLRGRRGAAEGRMHWSGNFDEVQDFEGDIRNAFGGAGFLSDTQWSEGTRAQPLGDSKAGLSPELDALAAYVSSLADTPASPYRAADGLTPEGRAGRELFARLECQTCHGGPDFTNSADGKLFDVGTQKPTSGKRLGGPLDGIDTPTLRGVWATPPYLHDGSAPTLLDVITNANPNDKHGHTAQLTDAERAQLVAYLQQIDDAEGEVPAPRVDVRSSPVAHATEIEGGCSAAASGVDPRVGWGFVGLAALMARRSRRAWEGRSRW